MHCSKCKNTALNRLFNLGHYTFLAVVWVLSNLSLMDLLKNWIPGVQHVICHTALIIKITVFRQLLLLHKRNLFHISELAFMFKTAMKKRKTTSNVESQKHKNKLKYLDKLFCCCSNPPLFIKAWRMNYYYSFIWKKSILQSCFQNRGNV